MRPLSGRVAVVTGASRGLGRAIAVALAEAGADVAVAARAKVDLEETAHQAGQHGVRTLALTTDVAVYPAVERLMSQTVSALGRLDIIVNNAGIARVAPLAEASLDDWQAIVDVNLSGVFYGCRAAAPISSASRPARSSTWPRCSPRSGCPGTRCTRRPRAP